MICGDNINIKTHDLHRKTFIHLLLHSIHYLTKITLFDPNYKAGLDNRLQHLDIFTDTKKVLLYETFYSLV